MRILLVTDGGKLPAVAGPAASVAELVGHVVPLVRPVRVVILRDESFVFVFALFPDIDVFADVRLEGATV